MNTTNAPTPIPLDLAVARAVEVNALGYEIAHTTAELGAPIGYPNAWDVADMWVDALLIYAADWDAQILGQQVAQ